MIQNFSTIIQQDVVRIFNFATNKLPHDREQIEKVTLASLRVLGAALMGLGVLAAASAIAASTPVGAVLILATAVSVFALGHDIFVMSKNESEQRNPIQWIKKGVKGFVNDFADLVQGKKDQNDAFRKPNTEGTFLRPIWDATPIPHLISKI
jgi:hypothetical protein